MSESTESLLFRSGDPNLMTSLVRGLEVLKAFSLGDGELSASEIGKLTGLSRAVVRRCLYTLCQAGYVRKVQHRYQVEAKVLLLAQSYSSSGGSLPALAQPLLESVSEQINESCSLAVMEGDQVLYVARSATRRIMTVSLHVGSRLPAHCTSLGRVLLSALTTAELAAYLQRNPLTTHTAKSITSKRDFKKAITAARKQGYALIDEELEIGLRSIAVPVTDPHSAIIAAMNVGVQATRVSKRELESRIRPILQAAASQLSDQIA